MDSERLYSAHDFADATGATGMRRAFLLAFTGLQLTFGQWQQHGHPVPAAPQAAVATLEPAPAPLPQLPALSATPPARSRRRRTAPDNAASTGAPA